MQPGFQHRHPLESSQSQAFTRSCHLGLTTSTKFEISRASLDSQGKTESILTRWSREGLRTQGTEGSRGLRAGTRAQALSRT